VNRDELKEVLQVSAGNLLVTYLGLPLSINYPKTRHYLTLIDKLMNRIEAWMATTLLFAGRIELIKNATYNILSYWLLLINYMNQLRKKL